MFCRDCSMTFVAPMPTESQLDEYNRNFFENSKLGLDRNTEQQAWYSGAAHMHRAYMERFLGDAKNTIREVVEIGPGEGVLAGILKEAWPQIDLMAIETDDPSRERLAARGIESVAGIDDLAATGRTFELVIASNVLEHVVKPVDFLKQLGGLLTSSGKLFLEVPCRDFEFKDVWESHLLFFDKGPLRRALELAGFTVVDISYFGSPLSQLRPKTFWSRLFPGSKGDVPDWVLPTEDLDNLQVDRVKAFEAHAVRSKPCRWLRAFAEQK
jgi:SAM-dependent methyltransferase